MSPIAGQHALCCYWAFHQISADPQQLRHDLGKAEVADSSDLVRLARRLGARAKLSTLALSKLDGAPLPVIARGKAGEFFIIVRARDGQVLIQRPGQAPETLSFIDLGTIWNGEAVLTTTRSELASLSKFDVTWFIPALVKYRGLLGEVLVRLVFPFCRTDRGV